MDTTFFQGMRPSSTIVTIREYESKGSGEVANYQLVFHINYRNALEKALRIVEDFNPANEIEEIAKQELIQSYANRILNIEENDHEDPHYSLVADENGIPVKGIKIHNESGKLHMWGFVIGKETLKDGTFKEVKSSEKTLAKKKIEALTTLSKFRQFIVDRSKVVVSEGEHFTP